MNKKSVKKVPKKKVAKKKPIIGEAGKESIIIGGLRAVESVIKTLISREKGDDPIKSAQSDVEDSFANLLQTRKNKRGNDEEKSNQF